MGNPQSKEGWHATPSKNKAVHKTYESSHKLSDWGCLDRFLYLGSISSYNPHDKHPQRENATCIDRLIAAGNGEEVVEYLLDLSRRGRTPRQHYLIYALAICARSNDIATKKKAYDYLNNICHIPTHFFLFVNYCKQESLRSKTTGWGRAHRRAIVRWYEDKGSNPVGLARLLTKYKARKMQTNDGKGEKWSHKKVLKLAHPKFEGHLMKTVQKYILYGFREAQKEMRCRCNSEFLAYIEGTEKAKRCTNENELVVLIKRYKLEREHIPTQMMNSTLVSEAVIANMKAEAKIRNISLMASKGLCNEGSESEKLIIDILGDETILKDVKVHPIKTLIALLSYKRGEKIEKTRTKNGKISNCHLKWNVNNNICQTLESAFYRSFQNVEKCGKRFLLAISLSKDMTKPCQGCPSINSQQAAAAMMMLTVKTERKYKVVVYSDTLTELNINDKDSLNEVSQNLGHFKGSEANSSLPILWATEKKKKYGVFILYSDNRITKGQQVTEALKEYRKKMEVPDARMIVVAMLARETIIADEQDPFILNIVGFDSNAAILIQEFANKEI